MLENQTPAEIDTQLAPIYAKWSETGQAQLRMTKAAADYRKRGARYEASAQRCDDEAAKLQTVRDKLAAEFAPFEAEFKRRGGWTRFYMVMNNGGHLHSSRSCSTCRWSTQFAWLPEFSGQDEAGVVDLAGEDACTVCFPSAPVHQQSRLPFRVEERAQRAAEAAERAAKKAAKGPEVVVGRKVFKTVRGAENEIGFEIENVVSRRYMSARDAEHRVYLDGLAADDLRSAREIAAAIADAVEGYDVEALLAKKFDAKCKQYRKAGWDIPADAKL